jgi:RNA-directed DNA polymerase
VEDAPVKTSAPPVGTNVSMGRVPRMQAKLHRWAVADPGHRFDDLFNLVHDPATLLAAFDRVATNTGANTPGSDGVTVARVRDVIGVPAFLDELRTQLKAGTFRPQPVRERKIPKPGGSGKLRKLGIPTVTDRVVQAALKLVLEPIFEADFVPVSYGFRPMRRAHDAVAEIHYYGSRGYQWVVDADIEACFDSISHPALLGRVRARIKDKRVVGLVKAFLKAGVLTELGDIEDSHTGTPQGGILSPLLANIALSVLDEHFAEQWATQMDTEDRRWRRRRKGLGTWRLIRYADDFVVMVNGTADHAHALREEIAQVLAPLGLRLSEAKTRVTHLSEGVDFLGFHLQWRRKRGTQDQWYVYTFVADRPVRQLKDKIRALTRRTSQQDPKAVLIRLNQILRGWSNYFKHAVASALFRKLANFVWRRMIRWLKTLHRWSWKDVRRWLVRPDGSWRPIAVDGTVLFDLGDVPIRRYRYRGNKIPKPWVLTNPA